jgi:hypothetical protein
LIGPYMIEWRPQGDSNPCRRRERPVSWTWLDDGDIKSLCDFINGGPCESRTRDQRIKSPLLYQTELTAHREKYYHIIAFLANVKIFFLHIGFLSFLNT